MLHREYMALYSAYYTRFFWKHLMPAPLLSRMFRYFKRLFEETAIEAYLLDRKDIGFFEAFFLGSDEIKKFIKIAKEQMQCFKRADIRGKFSGCFEEPGTDLVTNEWKAMEDCIMQEKEKVVDILHKRKEIIPVLGKRIVTQSEKIYQMLSDIYQTFPEKMREQDSPHS